MDYPYLAKKETENGKVVIFFIKNDFGVVILNEPGLEEYKFGKCDIFKESKYEFLEPNVFVRLNN